MSDELKFRCEMCGEEFDPDPDTMLECSVEVNVIDAETGEKIELTPEEEKEVLKETMGDDNEVQLFSRGAICMCLKCQDKWTEDADAVDPLEEE